MKAILFHSVLITAISAGFSSAYGQASIVFDHAGPVTYALTDVPVGKDGQFVEGDFGLALFFGAGIGYTSLSQLTWLPSPLVWVEPGYFSGTAVIPALSGSLNTFAVVAWATTGPYGEPSYDFNPTTPVIQGASALWTETVSDPPLPLPLPRDVSFTVQIVPEPSVLAVIGVSALAIWTACRRRPVEISPRKIPVGV